MNNRTSSPIAVLRLQKLKSDYQRQQTELGLLTEVAHIVSQSHMEAYCFLSHAPLDLTKVATTTYIAFGTSFHGVCYIELFSPYRAVFKQKTKI